jgi:hypothetical protein
VVQSAFIRIANVHSGPFSNRFETLEFVDLRGVIFLTGSDALVGFWLLVFVVGNGQSGGWHAR